MALWSERTGENVIKTLQGFKDFIMRGNVIDLSVGIVIGAAFTALVGAFTKSFIEPLIRVFSGGGELSGTFKIMDVTFDFATFINALITFLMTAAVVYFLIVTPMNRLAERRKKGIEPEPKAPSEEVILLQEIRDALLAANSPAPRQRVAAPGTIEQAQIEQASATAASPVRNTAQPRKQQGRPGGTGRR
jgi:large conductance mechanosensitive channel